MNMPFLKKDLTDSRKSKYAYIVVRLESFYFASKLVLSSEKVFRRKSQTVASRQFSDNEMTMNNVQCYEYIICK